MAFTREFIRKAAKESGVEIPKELEDALVNEHISARDAYADTQVKAAEKPDVKIKDSEEYKALKKEFDDYKADISSKQTKAAKEKAVRAYFESKGIQDANLTLAMRGCGEEMAALELEGEKIKDTKALDDLISGVFASLVSTTTENGAPPPADPPKNSPSSTDLGTLSMADYINARSKM